MSEDTKNLPTGQRVLLRPDHPWANHSGEVVRWEETIFGIRPVVRLDNGQECFVMKPEHWTPLNGAPAKGTQKRGRRYR